MKKSTGSVFLVFVFLTGLMSGCVSTSIPPTLTAIPPTETPVPPTDTSVPPTTTPTEVPIVITITTSLGDIFLTKAEVATENVMGDQAAPGFQLLNVWFESADGSAIDGSAFYDESKAVYVMGDDGSKTNSYLGGLVSGQLLVGFTPPESAHTFTLYWPGNEPVELTLSQ
jgi:hypothetical protein